MTPPVTQPVDDSTTADRALRLLTHGRELLWTGDFHNGRQLLKAVGRRLDRKRKSASGDALTVFQRQRAQRAERAGVLGRIVVDLDGDYSLNLRRAPDVREACRHAYGPHGAPRRVAFTELQGVLGAWQWHQRGVYIDELGDRVYPDYGVFSPTRREYIDLVDRLAGEVDGRDVLDIGTGTGVLAAVLARHGARVTATDVSERAVACARHNLDRLECAAEVVPADLWPENYRGDVVVFNPPWLPGTPTSDLELGIYDAESDALRRYLAGLSAHLTEGGQGWLILSDLAEHLGLRTRDQLEQWIAEGGLRVDGRLDTAPRHAKVQDREDPLHVARSREVTSLWQLSVA